jgi:adenylate cyclase
MKGRPMLRGYKTLLFSLAVGLVAVVVALLPWMTALEENLGLHLLFRVRGVRPAPAEVVVVALDRQSSKQLDLPMEPRLWPRSVHARLIERLTAAGATLIVFDLIFNEPQSQETDQALAQAIGRAGNVILTQSLVDETMALVDAQGNPAAQVNIEKTVPPLALLAGAALAQAPFPLPKVPIKLSRYWTFRPGAGDAPTMPVTAFYGFAPEVHRKLVDLVRAATPAAAALDVPERGQAAPDALTAAIERLRALFQKEPDLGPRLKETLARELAARGADSSVRSLRSMIRLNADDSIHYLNYYGPAGAIRTIAYHQLMQAGPEALAALDLKGRAVFVGQTESYWPKAKDGFYTVYASPEAVDISGVEIAATAFANLLEDNPVTPAGLPLHLAIVGLWGTAATLLCLRLPSAASAIAILLPAGIYAGVARMQFSAAGLWLPMILPLFILCPAIYFTALIRNFHAVSRERRVIRRAFGFFLPNSVVDQLARNIQSLQAERRVVYSLCLFTDAEQYTRLSESLDPQRLTTLMNQYYEAIFRPIRENGGLILQVVGDSVLSLWAAARPDPGLQARACAAALAVAEAVERFNARSDGQRLPTRIGMHAGEVVLGHIGAMDHFEYRPVGDIVNTASRLEGLNKYLGTRVLVSDVVLDQVAGFASRYVGKFVFVGKSKPVEVCELISSTDTADRHPALPADFARGLAAFGRCDWDAAAEAFARAVQRNGADGPAQFYLRLCDEYRQAPPDSDWDGAIHLKQK